MIEEKNQQQPEEVVNKSEDPKKEKKNRTRKTRAGIALTKEQVQEIKEGRKKLRKEMKQKKVYTKREFELTASSLGLYFDKHKRFGLLLWLFHGKALWALLGALLALLLALFLASLVTQMRGHFTVNLDENLFKNGFLLSEDKSFKDARSQLTAEPSLDVACVSISHIPEDIDDIDGSHNDDTYFAYTFYLKNVGEEELDYVYDLSLNSESQSLSEAAWIMLFKDGEMTFFAKEKETGESETLPELSDNTRGYRELPLLDKTKSPDKQYEVIKETSFGAYRRVIPVPFESDKVIVKEQVKGIKPEEIHKFTVVVWLEGDDPDCTDDLIGGHLGVEMNFRANEMEIDEERGGGGDSILSPLKDLWNSIFGGLKF